MENEFTIKSADSATVLRLYLRSEDYVRVSLTSPEFSGAIDVYSHDGFNHLVSFFESLAQDWKGWDGARVWGSLEGDFEVSATNDRRGHISLSVLLHRDFGNPEPWRLVAGLVVEAGQLDKIAADARIFAR